MKTGNDDIEYMEIVSEILKNREFNKLKDFTHHKTTRMEHSKRVAYLSYRICKKLDLDYVSAARGGMLHDFFLNRYTAKNTNKLIRNHPKIASTNAKKHFNLNKKEINILRVICFRWLLRLNLSIKKVMLLLLLINLFGDMKSLLDIARKLVLNWVNLIYIYLGIYN